MLNRYGIQLRNILQSNVNLNRLTLKLGVSTTDYHPSPTGDYRVKALNP